MKPRFIIPVHHDTSSAWGAHLWEPAVEGREATQDSPLGDIFSGYSGPARTNCDLMLSQPDSHVSSHDGKNQ